MAQIPTEAEKIRDQILESRAEARKQQEIAQLEEQFGPELAKLLWDFSHATAKTRPELRAQLLAKIQTFPEGHGMREKLLFFMLNDFDQRLSRLESSSGSSETDWMFRTIGATR